MNKRNLTLLAAGLCMIGASVLVLGKLKSDQKLGPPGIKHSAIQGKLNVNLLLPENVPGYRCESREPEPQVVTTLPPDTSMAQNLYTAGDGFQIALNVVLMGTDRTSIHKPQFCLVGSGWKIDGSEEDKISMTEPVPYELPVMKLSVSRVVLKDGQKIPMSGLYVYWFVSGHKLTASHGERVWSMARTLLTTGTLERWSYVSCLVACAPGQEGVAYERLKQFISRAVPQFQLVPGASTERAEVRLSPLPSGRPDLGPAQDRLLRLNSPG
jgi:hypothetical protein